MSKSYASSFVADDDLLLHASRVKGKVVVLTGGASGIGKETAFLFSRHGAKVVIGDISHEKGSIVAEEIRRAGGTAIFHRCDVLKWDDQLNLFQQGLAQFGSVDIVIPVAGITEQGDVCSGLLDWTDGKPVAPKLATLNVNLIGVLYTVHLGLYFMEQNRSNINDTASWKALILIGSMAAWEALPMSPLYTISKAGILGLMRSLYPLAERRRMRIAVIDPWFADTEIVPLAARIVLAGAPLTPLFRISQTILYAATDTNDDTNGCSWVLPDEGPAVRINREQFKVRTGVYETINARIASARSAQIAVRSVVIALTKTLFSVLWKRVFFASLIVAGGTMAVRRFL